jgi:putative ABC transport system permease protein
MGASRSDFRENLMLALDTLRTHKFRSLLTILGVLIGTFIVIIVASVIAGLNAQMMEAINQFGARNMYIYKFEPGIHFRLTREERMRKPLAFEDAAVIRAQCPHVETVAVEIVQWGPSPGMKYKDKELLDGNLVGATPEDFRIINAPLADGRFFN